MSFAGILLLLGFVLFAILMVKRLLPTLLALPLMAAWIALICGVPFFDWLGNIVVKGSFRLSAPIVLVVFGSMFAKVIQKTNISDAIINCVAHHRIRMFDHFLLEDDFNLILAKIIINDLVAHVALTGQ